MKLVILTILTFGLFSSCSRKRAIYKFNESSRLIYDVEGNIISGRLDSLPQTSVSLKDKSLNYTFILDSSHIYVSALDSIGNIIWKIDPSIGNLTPDDRATKTITNIYFKQFVSRANNKPYKVLLVRYGNRVSGSLDLKTGYFRIRSI